jgi:hypothetical protein
MAPGLQRVKGSARALRFNSYRAVLVVLGVASKAQALGFGASTLPKKHALYPALNVEPTMFYCHAL